MQSKHTGNALARENWIDLYERDGMAAEAASIEADRRIAEEHRDYENGSDIAEIADAE